MRATLYRNGMKVGSTTDPFTGQKVFKVRLVRLSIG